MSSQKQSTSKSARVVVVGSINIDMVARCERLPQPGETLVGEQFTMAPGGKGANQAVAAARLGAQVSFVSRVGTLAHGEVLLAALQAEGIDTSAAARDPAVMPGVAVIVVASEGGENSIVYVPGSNAMLSESDVQAADTVLRTARVVAAQLEVPQPAIIAAFERARAGGAQTILNAAPALTLDPRLASLTDWLVVNEGEAAVLSGLPTGNLAEIEAAAEQLRCQGFAQVVVTLGGDGLLMCGPAGRLSLAAPRVEALDTVGAGDTFVGGLACALAEGQGAEAALRLGQQAAAIAVSRIGVQSAMPRRSELLGDTTGRESA